MTAKLKPRSPAKPPTKPTAKLANKPLAVVAPLNDPWLTPPLNMEERLARIAVLRGRIEEHVQFMCGIEKLNGTSMEAKQKAVAHFYERLFLMEQELAIIPETLRLG